MHKNNLYEKLKELQLPFKFEDIIKKFWDYKLIIISILCLESSFYVYSAFWIDLLNKYWVNPFMKELYFNNSSAIIVLVVLSIFFSFFYLISFKNIKHYSWIRLFVTSFCLSIFIWCYLSGIWVYNSIAYCVILIFIAEICLCIKLKSFYKTNNFNSILEKEDTFNTNDSYNRKNVINSTFDILKDCFYNTGSFVIGIKGSWGSGKTTFINQLHNKFNLDKDKQFHIINFQPWRTDGANSLTRTFFKELEDNLKYYIPSISNNIDKYLRYILPLNEDYIGKLIDNIPNLISSNINPYEKMRNLFSNSKLPIIVFIDDIDRLSADEILEVLKLVRNTADFPFVQFVICYDSYYVVKALKNNGIENASKYLEKFFNVEIDLPSYEDRVVVKELWDRLEHIFETTWPEEKDEIENILFGGEKIIKTYKGELKSDYKLTSLPIYYPEKYKTYNVIRTLLPSVRDVIRFSNSFILITSFYEKISKQDFISGYNLLMIELLRYRYPEIYNILKLNTYELLKIESGRYTLIADYEQKIKKTNDYSSDELKSLEFILSIFYNYSAEYGICKVRSFPNYFMYREDEKYLKLYEILELSSLNDEELSIRIEKLYPQKYKDEFREQFYQLLFKTIIYTEDEETDIKNMINIDLYYLMERLVRLDKENLSIDIINAFNQFKHYIKRTTINNVKSLVNFIIAIPDKFINEGVYENIINDLIYRYHIEKFVYNYGNAEVKVQSKEILFTLLNADTHRCIKAKVINEVIQSRNKNSFDEDNLTIDENVLLEILKQYFIECKYKVSEEGFSLFNSCFTACKKAKDKDYSNSVSDNIKQIMLKEFEEHPNDALSLFISYTNNNVLYVNETFTNLFDGDDKIEEFILSHSNCEKYKCVSNFWRIYQYNDYNDVLLNNDLNIDDLIKNNLDELIQKLEYLLDIYKNFENYKVTEELKLKVYLFPLKIKLREKVLSMINLKLDKDKEAKSK